MSITNLQISPGTGSLNLTWEIQGEPTNTIIVQLGVTPDSVDWTKAPIIMQLPGSATSCSLPGNGPQVAGPQIRIVQAHIEDQGATAPLPVATTPPPVGGTIPPEHAAAREAAQAAMAKVIQDSQQVAPVPEQKQLSE